MWRTASVAGGALAASLTASLAPLAQASFVRGEPLRLAQRSDVRVRFLGQSAGASGALYFLGSRLGGVVSRAASSDDQGLGRFLFNNHQARRGFETALGVFDAGAVLDFAYLITQGVSVAPTGELFRTDRSEDLPYFAQRTRFKKDLQRSVVGVEDIRDPRLSDFDFNDVVFEVVARPAGTPAPAGAAVLGLGGAVALGLRRRRSEGAPPHALQR